MIDTSELLSNCLAMAKEAGKIQMELFRSSHLNIRTKYNESDVVTDADKRSEQLIISTIKAKYPTHSILSEESGASTCNSDYRWVIDPLDGTTSYSNGLPHFSVSIGVEYRGETIVGVVFAPYLNECFYVVKGEGAYLNGKRITPGNKTSLRQAVVATGFPVDKDTTSDNNLDNFSRVLPRVRDVRRLGSAAIDTCYVAAGFLDAYWELNLHEWDVCAALLIAKESGAKVDNFRHDRNISILVASPTLMPLIRPLISDKPAV